MELVDRIRIVRKYWMLLVLGTLLGTGAGWAAAALETPTYAATTRVFVSGQAGQTTADLAQGGSYTESRIASYANLAGSQRVLDEVIASLGLTVPYWELAEDIQVAVVPSTTVLEITATSADPDAAAALANSTAVHLTDAVADIESRGGQASPVALVVTQEARTPEAPTSPRLSVNLTLGALAGLLLALAVAALREVLDTRIRSEGGVRAVSDLPMLGSITFDPKAKQRPLVVHSDPLSPRSESFRVLRTNLKFIEVDERSRTFILTSPTPGSGKSTTTANLALALADAGERVILVDADLRKPKIAEYMNLEGAVGLSDLIAGNAALDDVVQRWGASSLRVLPAGQVPPNPSELLGSRAMAALIAQLRTEFDWVLFDSPPLLPVTDAAVLSEHVDAVIMLVAAGKTNRHELALALERLETIETKVGGIVLTMVPAKGLDVYGYGHRRYSAYTSITVPARPAPASTGTTAAPAAPVAPPAERAEIRRRSLRTTSDDADPATLRHPVSADPER